MNQRVKRSKKRKHQDIGGSVMHTGGHLASHRRDAEPVVRTPQKTTGDVPGEKAKGLAKASPFFKKLGAKLNPRSKEEEKKIIAAATEDPIGRVEETLKQDDEDNQE
jgi:hypothetical protein